LHDRAAPRGNLLNKDDQAEEVLALANKFKAIGLDWDGNLSLLDPKMATVKDSVFGFSAS